MNVEKILKSLPPTFSRTEVGKLFPGIISPKTLANMANKGEGPRFYKAGRHCIYVTEDFLLWLKSRSKPVSTSEQRFEIEA